jgi:hypothetical protein
MIKAVNIVNMFSSLSIDKIFKIDSNIVIVVKTSLTLM